MIITFLDEATVNLGDLTTTTLRRLGDYRAFANTPIEQLPATLRDSVEVVITNKHIVDAKRLALLPRLKLICVSATGVNIIDLRAAKRRGVAVANVPGYATRCVAEHTLMLILACSHRLRDHHHAAVDGEWSRSPHYNVLAYPFREMSGTTLGIIGYGHIGREVARLARAFGMRICIARLPRTRYPSAPHRLPLRTVLRTSDFVTIHCALSPKTQQLLTAERLALMKPTAYLINLARGAIVDETAVAKALRLGKLAGYASDVLGQEPPPLNHPLLTPTVRGKVLLTPHIAWAAHETRQRVINELATNIRAFVAGKRRNRVV